MPSTTTMPEPMPIRLMMTCRVVKAAVDIPKIIVVLLVRVTLRLRRGHHRTLPGAGWHHNRGPCREVALPGLRKPPPAQQRHQRRHRKHEQEDGSLPPEAVACRAHAEVHVECGSQEPQRQEAERRPRRARAGAEGMPCQQTGSQYPKSRRDHEQCMHRRVLLALFALGCLASPA